MEESHWTPSTSCGLYVLITVVVKTKWMFDQFVNTHCSHDRCYKSGLPFEKVLHVSCGRCLNCLAGEVELGAYVKDKSQSRRCSSTASPVTGYHTCCKSHNRQEKAWMQAGSERKWRQLLFSLNSCTIRGVCWGGEGCCWSFFLTLLEGALQEWESEGKW